MIERKRVQNGVTMFVTLNTWHLRQVFVHPKFARKAIEVLYALQKTRKFDLYGFVIMPDHIHLLLRIHAPDTLGNIMTEYKTSLAFDFGIGAFLQDHYNVRFPKEPEKMVTYINENPTKAGLSKDPAHYPWSSAAGNWKLAPLPKR